MTKPVYITFRQRDERFVGHSISFRKPTEETFKRWDDDKQGAVKPKVAEEDKGSNPFLDVITAFNSTMQIYRNMIPLTLEVSPMVSGMMANEELGGFVKRYGTEVEEFKEENFKVFELSSGHWGALMQRHDAAIAAVKGVEHLPEIAVIGLISVYDAYLSNLLRAVFNVHEELVFNSDREIKFSDLVKFGTIEEAKKQIIDTEVENVLRRSHHEQFEWMEKNFKMTLRKDLEVWPDFVELCERRNLLTHTGGFVSRQYLKNCENHGHKASGKLDEKLETKADYFRKAVLIVNEIGLKLGHVLWRKFVPKDREEADEELNEQALDLIVQRQYHVAERLLQLGTETFSKHPSDLVRRMMVVNRANALRLGKHKEKAHEILAKEDWSATATKFRICVAAVQDDHDTLYDLMRKEGQHGEVKADQYRQWPVFRRLLKEEKFAEVFMEVFGEPLIPGDHFKMAETEEKEKIEVGAVEQERVIKLPARPRFRPRPTGENTH